MATLKTPFYLILLLAGIGLSCQKDLEEAASPALQTVSVSNQESSALVAQIKFSLTRESSAVVIYWPVSGTEQNALQSAVSGIKKNHAIPLFQLRAQTTYQYKILLIDPNGQKKEAGPPETFTTAAVPEWLKKYYDESENRIQESLTGYYLVIPAAQPGGLLLLNRRGELSWYWSPPARYVVKTARFTPKNSLLMLLDEHGTPYNDGNVVLETNLAGDTLALFRMGEKGFDKWLHHDLQMDANGNLVAITNETKNNLPGDGLLMLDPQGRKLWEWSTFQELTDIDPTQYAQPWGNSLVIDKDNHYLVSFRALSQVWKIHSGTGKVLWKLGKNGTVKTPTGTDFLFQHFAHRNAQDEIMLFDNGGPLRPQTRVLSFRINETTLEATPSLNFALPGNLYSAIMGSAALLPDGSILSASAVNGKLVKTDPSGRIIWTLTTSQPIYRADYVPNPFGQAQ
ncbi:aryl-sulfate sulfotransferase [Larkinella insperata]|uniref:Aryl-sulfate sulfotransferase n=1 Tax=Larkinella insperata TaxID=332158 RepID=A0ABW3QK00_9BACT|nr:aryl-sulfate sulfotransferase [Larkinella insperata]